jgi:hypothetical protein
MWLLTHLIREATLAIFRAREAWAIHRFNHGRHG